MFPWERAGGMGDGKRARAQAARPAKPPRRGGRGRQHAARARIESGTDGFQEKRIRWEF